LSFGEKLSRRQVSASLGIPVTTVSDHSNNINVPWPAVSRYNAA
jgi:hypothetical protein